MAATSKPIVCTRNLQDQISHTGRRGAPGGQEPPVKQMYFTLVSSAPWPSLRTGEEEGGGRWRRDQSQWVSDSFEKRFPH